MAPSMRPPYLPAPDPRLPITQFTARLDRLTPIRSHYMINLFWRLLAKLLARPAIAAWLINRAQRTPYTRDSTEMRSLDQSPLISRY